MAQYLQSRIKDPIWLEPNEISFLRMRISEEEALVQTFESRMDELRAQISELMRQKDAKLVEIASLRNVLAPVRRVPLEILLDIFELVLEPRQWETNTVSHLFRLSSVCVAWRKATHATPQFWSTLRISIKDQDYTCVSDWITRCQMVPVNLYLNFYGEKSRVERGKSTLGVHPSALCARIPIAGYHRRSGGPLPSKIRGVFRCTQVAPSSGATGRAIDLAEAALLPLSLNGFLSITIIRIWIVLSWTWPGFNSALRLHCYLWSSLSNSSDTNGRRDLTEKVIAVLSLFPTIRSLEICPPFDVNALMQAITCTEGHHVLPNLQDLVLDGFLNYYDRTNEEEFRLSGSGFKSMVLSRWWPDVGGLASFRNGLSRLQKVTLRGFHVSDPAGDIPHVSALSGLILNHTPVR
ncbi:hypothetical protein BT96DRAFT_916811 [Gymnopus androsaceus JB14]|uniref:F-box domain-containing protein n=1 Tax=Gymnopus androsaceus JB14 TaxID=1447944 RepID=A0A6A4I3E4_9AGAR|nr:hypothetical protein BT96DRAFT_916811 [Gymnopus androsaceus JB14]